MSLVRICIGVSLVRISMYIATLVQMGWWVWWVILTSVMGKYDTSAYKKGTQVPILADMVLTIDAP